MSTRSAFTVHPAADIFPMMTDDELQELAADIAENGLQVPIVLDHTSKVLIDGRNRLKACEIAQVEPQFETLPESIDPVAFVISINVKHRFLTKGQQAAAEALLHPEDGGKGGRGKKTNLPQNGSFGRERLRQARVVVRYSRPLLESVLKGTITLNEAIEKVKQEQQFQSSDEAKLARLQKSAPDLADQVNEERLKINEAIAALQAREQELRRVCDDARRAAQNIVGEFCGSASAIIMGVDNGERITMPAKEIKQFHEMHVLLSQRIPEFADSSRHGESESAETLTRNLREYISERRTEINARPPRHYNHNKELLELLDDVEKQLDLTMPGSAA